MRKSRGLSAYMMVAIMITTSFSFLFYNIYGVSIDIDALGKNDIKDTEIMTRGGYSVYDGDTDWNIIFETIDDIEGNLGVDVKDGMVEPLLDIGTATPVIHEIMDLSEYNQAFKGSQNQMVMVDRSLFYVYSWLNGTDYQVSMIGSYDYGITWTSAVDVWRGPARLVRLHLYEWNGGLYIFIIKQMEDRADNKLYAVSSPISKWTDIRSAAITTIQDSYAIKMDVASDSNYIYVVSQVAGDLSGLFFYFDGQRWSSPIEAVEEPYCGNIGIEVAQIGSTSKIMFFYSRYYESGSPADGYVYMKYSTNLGSTWNSYGPVMDDVNGYYFVNCVNINGTHILFSDHRYDDELTMVISRDNGITWSGEVNLIKNRGMSTLMPFFSTTYSVSYDEYINRLYLIYEDSADRIWYVFSDDYGSNWIPEPSAVKISDPDSFDPLICTDSSLVSFMYKSGSTYNARMKWLNSYYPVSGFRTLEHSPPLISSWDRIGFDVFTPNKTYVH
ncbi:MAG: hypothetical protein ACMUIG_04260, partial [Thermoplasmatota archaeon]